MLSVDRVQSMDDARLDPYRDLRRTNQTRWCPYFIAEGRQVVRRLLRSAFTVRSVLLGESRLASFGREVPAGVQVLAVPDAMCSQLVGFDFHAGVMACADRKPAGESEIAGWPGRALVVACPATVLPDNLGSILRLAAAFGARGVAVGPRAADPFSRRAVRVSMGNLFGLDVFQPPDLREWLAGLRSNHGFEIVAAERTEGAERLDRFVPRPRMVLVLGNEADGVTAEWMELADRVVEIGMAREVDSLNVSTAAAILLYGLSQSGF